MVRQSLTARSRSTSKRVFNQKKFENLPLPQRHKKAAELLRHYWEMADWLEGSEEISNCYHKHLSLAGVQHKEHNLLPARQSDRTEGAPYLPIAIYLDHIRSAHNVGSIIRTVEAFRLGKIFLSEQVPDLDNKQVRDTSMGAWEWLSCEKGSSLAKLPAPLIALETSEEAIPLSQFAFPEIFTLAIGNEEYGCSERVLSAADAVVQIPLVGRKNSLNVANAFAIAAATIRSQYA
jgi:tRNA G18 (ribose-2'-O)-methylase SpoU